ncbi:MAG TPA: NAD(P)-binding domain-containing protein [Chthoniobacterales bacterium]|nr:NAD(P)-binding domain-containing protein [Chthoniobacterales bacterium]
MKKMKIGILGVGNIGKTIALRTAAAGHEAKVANSGDPKTVAADVLATGARAEWTKDVMKDIDVLILSIPFFKMPALKPLIASLPEETVVIDTSNYYPGREGYYAGRDPVIPDLDKEKSETEWIQEQLGHPVVKAWNNILAETLDKKSHPKGHAERLAIAIAADRPRDLEVAKELVELTGFDAFHTGSIKESWRQQPGAPVYCTDMKASELPPALAATERSRLPARRDLGMAILQERDWTVPSGFIARMNRVLYI